MTATMTEPTMHLVKGKDLRVGMVLRVWWGYKRDTIMGIVPYVGPLAGEFPEGASIVRFALCQDGMTVDHAADCEVVA